MTTIDSVVNYVLRTPHNTNKNILTEKLNQLIADNGGSGTASAVPDDEMLELLMDMDIVQPLSNTNNSVFIDTNDKLYVL